MNAKISIAEFFSWRHHPFADTYSLKQPFLSHKDKRIMDKALSLLSYGKSFAVTGPSGSGKFTLAQHIISSLDPHHYRPILIPYGGLQRGGILKAIADLLGVDASGRSVPLLTRLQKHISQMTSENSGLFPVIVIDDAQLMERDSLLDLCSLMINPQKKTVAASLILIGDEMLAKTLQLNIMSAIRTRLTCFFCMDPLNEEESHAFISFRLDCSQAPAHLFDQGALELIASSCHGNRRLIMNMATVLLDEAFYLQEKTVGSQLVLSCDLVEISG